MNGTGLPRCDNFKRISQTICFKRSDGRSSPAFKFDHTILLNGLSRHYTFYYKEKLAKMKES